MVRYEDAVQVMPPSVPFLLELVSELQQDFVDLSRRFDEVHGSLTTVAQQMKEHASRQSAAPATDPTLLAMMQEVLNCMTPLESAVARLQEPQVAGTTISETGEPAAAREASAEDEAE